MELVACIWPIIEQPAGIIRRFAARAYAMPEEEGQISQALRLLATSDYLLARQFPVPKNLTVTSPHGVIEGAIPFDHYNDQAPHILRLRLLSWRRTSRHSSVSAWVNSGPMASRQMWRSRGRRT